MPREILCQPKKQGSMGPVYPFRYVSNHRESPIPCYLLAKPSLPPSDSLISGMRPNQSESIQSWCTASFKMIYLVRQRCEDISEFSGTVEHTGAKQKHLV
ncbi:Hypothetical protein CINCED_3A007721 [Cinara cedri]|uniref:Uncharacterized protein n=1 Tax=Cinara cedri TaxID=506608 RepID=A0A5E4MMQ7_9HEMI|nr:Hypothetical protein CINCED_3A007721 [Cinara cedri]